MGCDIHMYGEVYKNHKWQLIGEEAAEPDDAEFYTDGRNYILFAALAGVRSSPFNNLVPPVAKPKGIQVSCCDFIWNRIRGYGTDGHSHSCLSLKELIEYDFTKWGPTCDDFRNEVIPKLTEALKESTYPEDNRYSRIVFWFDN